MHIALHAHRGKRMISAAVHQRKKRVRAGEEKKLGEFLDVE